MDVKQYEEIKGLIDKANTEALKAQGALDSIKKDWQEKYGLDDINAVEEHLDALQQELAKLEDRKNTVFRTLVESEDWDKIKEELS